jgi:pimeloyl-[acyl-carrier protein] methyl ester esterase
MADSMHVREAGAGLPILLLHGWSCHGGFFDKQARALAPRFHLLAPDLPGHGLTGRAGPALSIEAAADACAALIEARGLRGVLLVGWSMGASVAWSLIARHGLDRIAGLVVVDMSPRPLNDAEWRLGLRDGLDAARSEAAVAAMPAHWPAFTGRIVQSLVAEGTEPDPEFARWVRGEIAGNDAAAMATMWRSLMAQDCRDLLPRIDRPVLLAYGARSTLYAPEVFAWTAERLPRVRLARFDRSGHAPHLTEAGTFNAALAAFRLGL